jgi:hypothetical protein
MGETVRIEILQLPAGNVVAREIQTRGPEGKFHLRLSGQVAYRPPDDGKEWPAGQSIEVFVAAAEAWNKYRCRNWLLGLGSHAGTRWSSVIQAHTLKCVRARIIGKTKSRRTYETHGNTA